MITSRTRSRSRLTCGSCNTTNCWDSAALSCHQSDSQSQLSCVHNRSARLFLLHVSVLFSQPPSHHRTWNAPRQCEN